MADDYSQLLADVVSWSKRDDITSLAPRFLSLAEKEVNRVVRTYNMDTETTFTLSSPSYADDLPDGFLGFQSIYCDGEPLTYLTPSRFHDVVNSNSAYEMFYTVEAGKVKISKQGASDPVTLNAVYIAAYPALSITNTSNWLSTNHYDVYLWAALREAWDYVDDSEMVAKYQARFDRAVSQIADVSVYTRIPSGPLCASRDAETVV